MSLKKIPVIFSPDNEPYLGRKLLFHFDQLISSAMEQNADTAPKTHNIELSDRQHMACQTIAQSLSLTLSIRELIRQGYLFSAHVLVRSLIERASILLYLHLFPDEIDKWNRGWKQGDAPGLAKMFEKIQEKSDNSQVVKGSDLTKSMNDLIHGKPDSAIWNMISLENGEFGHASSKILHRPDLCDDLCAQMIPWVIVVQSMMADYFPNFSNK